MEGMWWNVQTSQDVHKPFAIVPQSATASCKIRSLILSRRPRSLTTSTLIPNKLSSSRIIADWLSSVEPGINSTRISKSLSKSASPRATEPKIRTLRAPFFAAISTISSRFAFIRSSIFISFNSLFIVDYSQKPKDSYEWIALMRRSMLLISINL
jgi:hypothetical protein